MVRAKIAIRCYTAPGYTGRGIAESLFDDDGSLDVVEKPAHRIVLGV